ncbi:hypothetical protein Naga_100049g10 [Nannochloropsis gaditana]|uniref:Uncharacterized protein n=1 Tax=Nannochloropsis gaditana TaxID=72520 RepID=W7TWL8_9STRA|nr:hypothetical protein Naga_100049g10 [Nannochloropsis gaditana]
MPEQSASAGGRASRAPPQVVVKAALDHVARRGREGCTVKEIWDECEVGCDSALKAFLWRALRRQRKYVFCRKTAVARPGSQRGAIKGEKNCKAENWAHAPLNAEELDSLSLDAWDSVMVIASEDHRLRALGALHASDLPEETHGTEILEILAAAGS